MNGEQDKIKSSMSNLKFLFRWALYFSRCCSHMVNLNSSSLAFSLALILFGKNCEVSSCEFVLKSNGLWSMEISFFSKLVVFIASFEAEFSFLETSSSDSCSFFFWMSHDQNPRKILLLRVVESYGTTMKWDHKRYEYFRSNEYTLTRFLNSNLFTTVGSFNIFHQLPLPYRLCSTLVVLYPPFLYF